MNEEEISQEIEAEAKASEAVETADVAVAEVQEEQPKPEVVPKEQYDAIHKAMDAERHKRREIQSRMEEEIQARREREARLEERLNVLNKMWGVEEKVDPEVERQKEFASQKEALTRTQQEIEQLRVVTALNAQEAQFASATPDYANARSWFFNKRAETLQALGYSEEDAQKQIGVEVNAMIGRALQNNQNAASLIYEASKKMGFIPESEKGKAKLEVIKAGQETNQQMPRGTVPKGPLTVERLASMSDAEFRAMTEDDFRRVMGG